jgi:hypothetical protein
LFKLWADGTEYKGRSALGIYVLNMGLSSFDRSGLHHAIPLAFLDCNRSGKRQEMHSWAIINRILADKFLKVATQGSLFKCRQNLTKFCFIIVETFEFRF